MAYSNQAPGNAPGKNPAGSPLAAPKQPNENPQIGRLTPRRRGPAVPGNAPGAKKIGGV